MKTHNTLMATLLMAIMILAMIPSVMAEETSAEASTGIGVSVSTGSTSAEASASADASASTQDSDKPKTREAKRQEMREEAKERAQKRADERAERVDERTAARLEVMGDKFADIRAHQKTRIETAMARCENAPDPAKCKEGLTARMETIAKLEAKDLEVLAKLEAKRSERVEKIKDLSNREAFKAFKAEGRARVIAKDRMDSAREHFKDAKAKAKEAREHFKARKEEVKDLRGKAREACKENETSEGCVSARAEVKAKAKESLSKAATAAIETLTKISVKVDDSEELSDAESAQAKAKIQARIDAVNAIKAKIDALPADAPASDVEALAKELRAEVAQTKKAAQLHAHWLVNSRMGGVIVKSKHLEARLQAVLEKSAEKGKDVATVDTLVDSFHANLEVAAKANEEARALFLDGKIEEGQTKMKAAKDALAKAHDNVKAIHDALKSSGLDDELASADVEAQATADTAVSA